MSIYSVIWNQTSDTMERADIVNNTPTVALNTPPNEVYYEGSTLNIFGTAQDKDVDDAVIVKYRIGSGAERILTTQVSNGQPFEFGKILTFRSGRFFDGETAVSDFLTEGNTYQLHVYAQDDKGAKSDTVSVNFTVVPNRNPVLSITETPTVANASLADTLLIKGTVEDPDGDAFTLKYRIGSSASKTVAVSAGNFTIEIPTKDLSVGVNDVVIIATDVNNAITQRTVRITLTENATSTAHIQKRALFRVDMGGKETDGVTLFARRPLDDTTQFSAKFSAVDQGAVESFVDLTKTVEEVPGLYRDRFVGETMTPGNKVNIMLDITGEGDIDMLQGVIK